MPRKNQNSKNKSLEPYQEEKFETFLQLIKKGNMKNWSIVAEALGVHNNTITAWKRHPDARKAIAEGILDSLDKMEKAGKNDWRMHAEKAKMLGVNPPQKVETTTKDDPVKKILIAFGLWEEINVGKIEEASGPTPEERP